MNIDEVITLDDNKEYLLLTEVEKENQKYFLAVGIENENPTNNYFIFKQIEENGEYSVEEVKDQELLTELLDSLEDAAAAEDLMSQQ